MSEETPRPSRSDDAPKRRGKAKKRHTVGTVIMATMLALTLVVGLGAVAFYRTISGNLNESSALDDVNNRPEEFGKGAIRILVMATDTREGEGNEIDREAKTTEHSDTNILLHISADRSRAYGISIPRDSLVTRPACGKGDSIPAQENATWNDAYEVGKEGCTVEQFEYNTGVRVNGFVKLDFRGFKDMVDALGGVPVCVPFDIDDPEHDIFIKAGEREISGDEALDYVRVRNVGTKSDLARITRQQTFIASMTKKVSSAGTLARPDKVMGFLSAVTKSLTISEDLANLKKLAGLGLSLQDVGLGKVQFLTVPVVDVPVGDPNWGRVLWTEESEDLWDRIKHDKPLTQELTERAIKADRAPGEGKPEGDESDDGDTPTTSPTPSTPKEPTEEEIAAAEYEARCA